MGDRAIGPCSVRDFSAGDLAQVTSLAARSPYAPLRYMRLFGFDVANQELEDRVVTELGTAGAHLVAERDGEVVGAVTCSEVVDLSTHFSVPVFEIGAVLGGESTEVRAEVSGALLDGLRERVADAGTAMVMLRVETDDAACLGAAEDVGFRVMETSLTWVNDLERRHLNEPVSGGHVVEVIELRGGDTAKLAPLAVGADSVMRLDHYHVDPRLPDDLCDSLYRRRFERAMAGVLADVAVVSYQDGEVAGAGFWRRWTELERYGIEMAGAGYGFRVPGMAPGTTEAFTSLVCNEPICGNRFLEWTTQATNFPQVNMTARQRSIRLVRSSHVLHLWTG